MVSLKFHNKYEATSFIEVNACVSSAEILIEIIETEKNTVSYIFLDKKTAIKLSKELRKQIALIE